MRVTEHDLAERKKRLIHVAYELFCEYGIDAVTLSQIAKKSNISLNSIYHYYDSKATLVRHTQYILWAEIVERMLSDSQAQLDTATNGWEELRILVLSFKELYKRHNGYLLFACDFKLYLVRNNLKLSKTVYNEILLPVYRTFSAALERGQADGSISREESVETQFFAIWGVARGFVEQIVVYDKMYDYENPWRERFGLVLEYILEGVKNKE